MANCSIDGCAAKVKAKGLCNIHYNRIRRHGSPESLRGPYGKGSWSGNGYKHQSINGKRQYEHRLKAMQALGKPLPVRAVVHHHYGKPSTLVICPDQAYHMLLHMRMRMLGG